MANNGGVFKLINVYYQAKNIKSIKRLKCILKETYVHHFLNPEGVLVWYGLFCSVLFLVLSF